MALPQDPEPRFDLAQLGSFLSEAAARPEVHVKRQWSRRAGHLAGRCFASAAASEMAQAVASCEAGKEEL